MEVDVAHVLVLAGDGRDRSQRRAAEERHLDVAGEDVEREEPALALDAVERRVPLHGLAHVGHGPRDERVEALPDVALPARHRRDVGLHRGVAVRLRDLRIAAREEDDAALLTSHLRLRAWPGPRRSPGGRLAWLAHQRLLSLPASWPASRSRPPRPAPA